MRGMFSQMQGYINDYFSGTDTVHGEKPGLGQVFVHLRELLGREMGPKGKESV